MRLFQLRHLEDVSGVSDVDQMKLVILHKELIGRLFAESRE